MVGGNGMFASYQELEAYVRNEGVEMLDFKVTEISGKWRHLSIPASRLSPKLFEKGFGFDGSNYGYAVIESSDMVFIPDVTTAFVDPFWERPTLSFLGGVYEIRPEGFRLFSGDSRSILRNALEVMRRETAADQFVIGPEFEFYIFDSVRHWNRMHEAGFAVDAEQAEWRTDDEEGSGFQVPRKKGYHVDAPGDLRRDLRAEMAARVDGLGVKVKYHHHEVGGPGQHEIEVELGEAAHLADATMLVKYVIKNTAFEHGSTATFMPKPLFGEAGSGMHVHMQLFREGKSLFAGPDTNYAGLSDLALAFMGGILAHTPALMALGGPSTNSYRRLVRGYEAPIAIAFATGNRSAVIRVPGYAKDPESRRFEFRSGDATCNPYLFYAALLLAGLDGVRRSLDPVQEGFGPLEKNIYEVAGHELKLLPASLDEALDALLADGDFLTADGVFSRTFLEHWVTLKRREAKAVAERPTPQEFDLYYDC